MAQDEKPKRNPPIPWRPPEHKRAEILARIDASGLSRNAFITDAVLRRNNRALPEFNLLAAKLLAQSAETCDLIRAFRSAADEQERDARLDRAIELQIEIRNALFELMGRKP